jgi:hypothetical protein
MHHQAEQKHQHKEGAGIEGIEPRYDKGEDRQRERLRIQRAQEGDGEGEGLYDRDLRRNRDSGCVGGCVGGCWWGKRS